MSPTRSSFKPQDSTPDLTLEEKIRILVKNSQVAEEDCGMDASKVYEVLGNLQSALLELITH